MTKKLYCYVDESGQDTGGKLFIVSVVITGEERDELQVLCEQIEAETKRGKLKWRKTRPALRLEYLKRILSEERCKSILYYSVFQDTIEYDLATVLAITRAVEAKKPDEDFTTLVYVDGLAKPKRHQYGRELRRRGIPTRKVQGIARDESNALIRLADSIAGLVRDVIGDEASPGLKEVFEKAKQEGFLCEE